MKRIIRLFLCVLTAAGLMSLEAFASPPHATYEYSTDNYNNLISSEKENANAKSAPDAFVYSTALNSQALGSSGGLKDPTDIFCDEFGNIIVSDAGNARIVVISASELSVSAIYASWESRDGETGDFKAATGIYAIGGVIYVCLQEEGRILAADYTNDMLNAVQCERLAVKNVMKAPDLSSVTDRFEFRPKSVTVDESGRLYIIVQGVYDGLVMLDTDGAFLGFIGANKIKMSLWERFWRSVSTAAQIESSLDTVPVEFYAMDIDGQGFIYTTSKGSESENTVRRLNLIGNDVLKASGAYIKGDLSALCKEGSPGSDSNLIDIDVTDNGIYTCLDNARGRVFTYDNDGNLLFVFGGLSARKGGFSVPCAVSWCEDKLLILDRGSNELIIFEPTVYGNAMLKAARSQYSGLYGESFEGWQEVLKLNPDNEIANKNVGKLKLDSGDYKSAMRYFKLANDRKLYSKAFIKSRAEGLTAALPWIAAALIAVLIISAIYAVIKYCYGSKERFNDFLKEIRKSR